uniref:Uncharacterized protein n=1 Tax=Cryptomonas curvata TaxID=233186 RepID=A0A7S0MF27_9CRYP
MDDGEIMYSLVTLRNNAERNGEEKAERKTRELIDAAERKTQELMQLQIDALNLRIDEAKIESQIAGAQLTTAINKQNYLKACLRTIGLRYVTESFYIEISNRARDTSSPLHTFLKENKTSDGTISHICKMVADPKSPLKLNQMDVLLCNKTIRAEIYAAMLIKESDLPYPTRHPDKSNYIYGYLSNAVHFPDFHTLWLRDDEDEDIRQYASFLADRYAMSVDSFDREAAATGYDEVCSETKTAPPSLQSSGKSSTENRENGSGGLALHAGNMVADREGAVHVQGIPARA